MFTVFTLMTHNHRRTDYAIGTSNLKISRRRKNHMLALAALSKRTEESIGDGKFPL